MRPLRQTRRLLLIAAVVLVGISPTVWAQSSSSPNYRVDESFFGTGGELDASSSNYRAKQTSGELVVGFSGSPNYQMQAGFNTTDEPFLEFVVTQDNIDLGYLSTGSTATANGTFAVRAWQSGGYVVRTESNPPTNPSGSTHQLTPLSSPTGSSTGSEQFGINLVANTSPTTFGDDPQQMPDSSYSFGEAATGYDTPNQYKYAVGDVIALSTKSTSITLYTVSYIFNISDITPAGQYTFRHILVATATF